MTKNELIKALADRQQIAVGVAEVIVDEFLELIALALAAGEEVQLRRFGKFVPRERDPGLGRNPRTGESIWVDSRISLLFKPAMRLKQLVNPKDDNADEKTAGDDDPEAG